MIKGKWYKEVQGHRTLFLRYFGKHEGTGLLLFDKSIGGIPINEGYKLFGYPGMDQYLEPLKDHELKELELS